MKRRIRISLLAIPLFCVLLAAALHLRSPAQKIPAASQAQQLAWLASHGLECEWIGMQEITIPTDFSGNYAEYAVLQEQQSLPLRAYAGRAASCVTYRIQGTVQPMYAELLIADGILIGAQRYDSERSETLPLQGNPSAAQPAEPS